MKRLPGIDVDREIELFRAFLGCWDRSETKPAIAAFMRGIVGNPKGEK